MERLIPFFIAKLAMMWSRIIVNWIFREEEEIEEEMQLGHITAQGHVSLAELRQMLEYWRTLPNVSNTKINPPLQSVDPDFFGGEEKKQAFLEEFSDVLKNN